MASPQTVTLYRPIGPAEYKLLKKNDFTRWPPRLEEQSLFYPVTNEDYAALITRTWNVKEYGIGYVTRFEVAKSFMDKYPVQTVGAAHHTEWWIPAEHLEELNNNIRGKIEVVATYKA